MAATTQGLHRGEQIHGRKHIPIGRVGGNQDVAFNDQCAAMARMHEKPVEHSPLRIAKNIIDSMAMTSISYAQAPVNPKVYAHLATAAEKAR